MKFARLDSDAKLDIHQRLISLRRALTYLSLKDVVLNLFRQEEKFYLDHVRDRQLNCCKSIVSVLFVLAHSALYGTFELALHQVNNY